MRKYILLFIALCLHGLARGQTSDYTGFYWFDNQQGKPTVLPSVDGTFDIDASALSDGIHTFHYIVAMKDGGLSAPFTSYFVKALSSEASIKGFYWFDNQQGKPKVLPTVQGLFDLDASSLSEGLHAFHYAVVKEDGGISTPYSGYFLKMQSEDLALKGFYWFDNEPTVYEAPNLNGLFNVDASSLSDGFHQISFIATQSGSGLANPSTCYFLKIAQVAENDSLTCLCSVDKQLRHIEKLPQQGGVIHWDLDMQDIADGIHHIQLQAVTKSGALSNSYGTYFMRLTSMQELSEMRCVYAIDGSSLNSNSNVVGHDGSYHFDLDLSDLEEGLHYISFLLHNERGTSTKVQTRFFLKTPLGGNGITQYQYWLNDESIEQAKTVKLPEKVNPLQLMSLLPVESRPLRSSLFHFDTSSGKPMIYAKNTIHLRFYDAAMRFSDAAKDYADYSQSQEVKVIKALESGVRETTGWPEENQIKWYSVTAERGDSLSFKTDLAATLQLFSPSGKEVYSASGFEVMQWDGCHAEENGTYYLALHDVTATEGEAISIDYEHIDRYAVLRQDVDVVGNAGYSTITFDGNGFDELTSVDLVFGDEVISSVEIGHESKVTTTVKFDFRNAQLGEYKAMFRFTEGELTIEKCVTVEDAVDIELATTVFANSTFMKWDTNNFVFEVNNQGNMTAYDVPMNLYIYTENHDYLTYAKVHGYDMLGSYKDVIGDKYTDSLSNVVNQKMIVSGDKLFFVKGRNEGHITNNPCVYWAPISLDLRPGINELSIEVKMDDTHRTVHVYLGVPEYWDNNVTPASPRRRALSEDCIKMEVLKCKHIWDMYVSMGYDESMLTEFEENGCIKDNCGSTGTGALSIQPGDPNDIFGYLSEAESKYMTDSVARENYTIEFENDPEIATAAAHEIIVIDTLDASKFNLSTYTPTKVKIGEKYADLTGNKNFVTTVDMRPEINAIAQVEGTFNEKKGIAKWHISSLDPMTMEPTEDVMQGILPVNFDGTSGIGMVMFNIGLKQPLSDGTEVPNRASIIFDKNEAILTPTWTNIVDAVAPSSIVDGLTMLNDSTLRVFADASDERSGVWKYEWYVQHGENAPWWKEGETNDDCFDFHFYEGFDYGFCVVVTDSAGNVEKKELARERIFKSYGPDFEDKISPLIASPEVEGQVYDLAGRRHNEPQGGVNIINKKKVLFRRKGK